ncbi:MAG: DUF2721 domain-containing protein [Ignavibacteriaceae bacterium]|nr:DUF2721 domain-containing protein [Ignavibacteriaceae bacterium]
MLAPGLMISACGLLILGMNNKYSIIVNRIRQMNEEKRRFMVKAGDIALSYDDEVRLKSIAHQLSELSVRLFYVRNAVISYSVAVALFVLASMFIGVGFVLQNRTLEMIVIFAFSVGMLLVLSGVIFAALESKKGFDIVKYEIKVHE